jgi:uncharacterized iron-regulated protein
MKRLFRSSSLLALVPLLAPLPASAADRTWNLALGDPARKEKTVAPLLDGVQDLRTGEALTPAAVAERMKGVRLLFLGESHTEMEVHRMQLRVLQELRRAGRRVHVGLEMYPYTEQAVLDEWNGGKLAEEAFVQKSRWYKNWGYHWDYYREIFTFCRDNGVPMHGVNTPREILTAVRTKGFDKLTPEEASRIPPRIDTDSVEGKTLFAANFSADDSMHGAMPPEQLDAMYRAQSTWDATMAYNAVRALKADPDPAAIMVVLIGSGHVVYGLGAERQAKIWFDGKTATLVAVPVRDEKDAPVVIRASVADFAWGIPRSVDPVYPALGLSTREAKSPERLVVIAVEKESVAAAAGFLTGDELVTMDGKPVPTKEAMALLMSGKRWADAAVFQVKRGDATVSLTALLRRQVEPEKKAVPAEGKPKP